MSEEILRTFIAIELDEPLRLALERVQTKFKRQISPRDVKWVAAENIHLTLKFLGDTPRARLPEIAAALQAACAGHAPFEVSVEGRGCFPNFRRPRVVWAAMRDKGQALARLQAAVEKHIAPLGWPTEDRSFSPHLTLGRVVKGVAREAEEEIGRAVEKTVVEQIGVQRVTAVSLMQSDLRPAGPVYTCLLRVPLVGDAAD